MLFDFTMRLIKISLSSSVLIGLLLLLVPFLRKRYQTKWRYLAWLIISLRLMIPINFTMPIPHIPMDLPEFSAAGFSTGADLDDTPQLAPPSGIQDISITYPSADPIEIMGIVWLSGAVIVLLFQFGSYLVFLKRVKKSAEPLDFLLDLINSLGNELGILRLPKPMLSSEIDAPVLFGFFHPRILFPHTGYPKEQINYIMRHELAHYQRHDMWYKLLLACVIGFHWFNPLVWLMAVQAAKDIEFACDEDVIRYLDKNGCEKYADTMISALPRKGRKLTVFTSSFGDTKKNMKNRLTNLFDTSMKRKGIGVLCAFAVCMAACTGMVTFGYAAEPIKTEAKNLTIDATGANLIVELSEDGQYHYDYNSDKYDVSSIETEQGKTIQVKSKSNITEGFSIDFVKLKIPDIAYDKVTYLGKDAGLNLPSLNVNMDIQVESGSCGILFPKDYQKTCSYKLKNGAGSISFAPDANNFDFIIDIASTAISFPAEWSEYKYFNKQYQYSKGEKLGNIHAEVENSSFSVNVSTSKASSIASPPAAPKAPEAPSAPADPKAPEPPKAPEAPKAPAAPSIPDAPMLSDVEEGSFSIKRLGAFPLNTGDSVNANLTWENSGSLLLLITPGDYNDDELLAPLQGIPGLPKPNTDNIKKKGKMFHFSVTPDSPLARNWEISQTDTYYLYLFYINSPVNVGGTITLDKADGTSLSILKS